MASTKIDATHDFASGPVEAGEIEKYLPHRYPFLLIDRVVHMELEPEKNLRAIKNVSMNRLWFRRAFLAEAVLSMR